MAEWSDGRKRHWGRWVLLLALLGVMAVTVVPHFWANRLDTQIQQRIARYQAAGDPVSAADLAPPPLADVDNAVVDLRQAAQIIDAYRNHSAASKAYEAGDDGYPFTAKERAIARTIIGDNQAIFGLMDSAMDKGKFSWPNPPVSPLIGWLLPDLSPQRGLARFCALAVRDDHDRRDDAATLRDLRRGWFTARGMDAHPPVIVVALVAIGMHALVCEAIHQVAPDLKIGNAPGEGSPADVKALIAELLDETSAQEAFHRSILAERLIALDTTYAVLSGKLSGNNVAGGFGGVAPAFGAPGVRYFTGPWMRADLITMLDADTLQATAAQATEWPTAQALSKGIGNPFGAPSIRHAWGQLLMPSLDRAVQTHFRGLALQRLAAVALAARWYAVDHGGKGPATLDALVPNYLPGVPRDPFAAGGAPLRWLASDVDARVYSVGENGVDDGGSEVEPRPQTTKNMWAAKDAVWHLGRQVRDLSKLPADLKD